jgi:chorismate synthase
VQIHEISAKIDRSVVTMKDVEKNRLRCPDAAAAKKMASLIEKIRGEGDSVGGVIECVARGIPAGTGRACF